MEAEQKTAKYPFGQTRKDSNLKLKFKKFNLFESRDPWWVFPFEAMEAIAVHLMWVSAATYCAVIAPKNLLATLIGVLGMAHFSLGMFCFSKLAVWFYFFSIF